MKVPLAGKVVLITGASSGFGEDAALLFAAEGCKVVLAARRVERLQALAEKIQSQGGEALAIPVDVADRADIENMVAAAIDLYGQIDILFNNAGFGHLDWLEKLNAERDIDTQVHVNLLGVIHTTRLVLPHMLRRGEGHIINMSSAAGLIAAPMYTVYSATKFGVRAFTDALRREVAPLGLFVTGFYPGPARTEFRKRAAVRSAPGLFSELPFLIMSSEEVAQRVVQAAVRRPRTVVIPWWFRVFSAFDAVFPGAADRFFANRFTKRYHTIEEKQE